MIEKGMGKNVYIPAQSLIRSQDKDKESIMDILGSLMGSAKQMAQNVIMEKLDKSASSEHPLLNMLHDAFAELDENSRKELFATFETLFEHYKAQPNFEFEVLWQELVKSPVIQDIAVKVSKRVLGGLMQKDA
jgi:hypothetical protein